MTTTAEIEDALHDVRATLNADGYHLEVRKPHHGRIVLVVTAGPDACADCLVPRETLSAVIANHLQGSGVYLSTELLYPGDQTR